MLQCSQTKLMLPKVSIKKANNIKPFNSKNTQWKGRRGKEWFLLQTRHAYIIHTQWRKHAIHKNKGCNILKHKHWIEDERLTTPERTVMRNSTSYNKGCNRSKCSRGYSSLAARVTSLALRMLFGWSWKLTLKVQVTTIDALGQF